MTINDPRLSGTGYASLSLKDLIDARDAYHVHLMRHPNVVATAIGRYLIRKSDPWPKSSHTAEATRKKSEPRRLDNSETRPYSWPAILVFVEEWLPPEAFSVNGRLQPDQMVPSTIYLPDGRSVPICVVEAPRLERTPAAAPPIRYPLNNIGGGFPVLADVQNREHVATIGCLVTDGHRYYGLTNRHVIGDAGEVVYSRLTGKKLPIGRSSSMQLTRIGFSDIYPGWGGRNVYVNLDIGMIDIDDITSWSASIRSIGYMGPLVDLSVNDMSLSLIGAQVRGYGAAGGLMLGEVHALFYRYKSRAGFEYVSDFFIGPRTARDAATARKGARRPRPAKFVTYPGDSGTLWLLDAPQPPPPDPDRKHAKDHKPEPPPPPRPLALQWGANVLGSDPHAAQPYVLATCLSTVCNQLSIDPVRDWNVDQPDTWGAVGHFSIAARATGALSRRVPKLAKLMTNNLPIISHDDQTILESDFKGMGDDAFVPMADVPDFFWKHGKQGASRHFEGPNHFADMDQVRASDGVDLLALCKSDANIDPAVWDRFYGSVTDILSGDPITPEHRGLLPFRVWQIFDEMVDFAAKGKRPEFVCAAGVLAHYVGDACQPLHISFLHDGDPQQPVTKTVHHKDGTVEDARNPLGMGVHSAYEDDMVNANRQDILDGLTRTPKVTADDRIDNGFAAAKATIGLMRDTFKRLPPVDIVDAFLQFKGSRKDRAAAFWRQFGPKTVKCMQDGTHLIAALWESAWLNGSGDTNVKSTAALEQAAAMKVVANRDFLPSLSVAQIGARLKRP